VSDLSVSPVMRRQDDLILPGAAGESVSASPLSCSSRCIWTVEEYADEVGLSVEELRRLAAEDAFGPDDAAYQSGRGSGG
jgi:hypothetical protein